MPEATNAIPVVDCETGILENGTAIFSALRDVGFVYLLNCGITPDEVAAVKKEGEALWELPLEVKERYARPAKMDHSAPTGYFAPGAEVLNPEDVATEIRESFNFCPTFPGDWNKHMPSSGVLPTFREGIAQFFSRCTDVAFTITKALAREMHLDDDAFTKFHSGLGKTKNSSTLRLIHYPELEPHHQKDGVVRMSEHCDIGTVTLLFQDSVGGLQVRDKTGEWMDAPPVEGAVLLNTGDILQRWTSDLLRATKHRVITPPDAKKYGHPRYSVIYFLQADDEAVIQPLSSDILKPSPDYEPVSMHEFVKHRIAQFYGTAKEPTPYVAGSMDM